MSFPAIARTLLKKSTELPLGMMRMDGSTAFIAFEKSTTSRAYISGVEFSLLLCQHSFPIIQYFTLYLFFILEYFTHSTAFFIKASLFVIVHPLGYFTRYSSAATVITGSAPI